MNICCEGYFKLSQDKYLEIKTFMDNNIDIIESVLAPMNDYFDSCKKCYCHYYCSCYYYIYTYSTKTILHKVFLFITKKY